MWALSWIRFRFSWQFTQQAFVCNCHEDLNHIFENMICCTFYKRNFFALCYESLLLRCLFREPWKVKVFLHISHSQPSPPAEWTCLSCALIPLTVAKVLLHCLQETLALAFPGDKKMLKLVTCIRDHVELQFINIIWYWNSMLQNEESYIEKPGGYEPGAAGAGLGLPVVEVGGRLLSYWE